MNPRIFILADWYLPGYKAGGLVTALANLADSIGDVFDLYVFTRDRDLTDRSPYPEIRHGEWQTVGRARVLYTSNLSFAHLRRRILEISPSIIYLNSFFSPLVIKTLCLRKLGLFPNCAIVLAPHGELSPGALQIKRAKKRLYKQAALRAGLCNRVVWHATSGIEAAHIGSELRGAGCKPPCIRVASDLPNRDWARAARARPRNKQTSRVRFLFISRVAPIKNLLFALDELSHLTGHVEFNIFGPIDDAGYWAQCEKRIQTLPHNITVRYGGTIARALVPSVISDFDFFLLPTEGENFGYAILEAMASGCPVIVSDRTPWRNLSGWNAGWALALDDRSAWRRVLQQCVEMGPRPYAAMSSSAREFVEAWATSTNQRDEMIRVFLAALEGVISPGSQSVAADASDLRKLADKPNANGSKTLW
ncbi:MAG: glycosyltransferase family 4 protein [Candidatus Acidiferrales bacterium]